MNIAIRIEAMLAGGRLKTLVFITFNVSAGNRKQQHSVTHTHTHTNGLAELGLSANLC